MNGDLGINHYWKSSDESLLCITTNENSNIGEGWVEITSDEYFKLAVSQASLAVELAKTKTDG